MSQTTRDPQLVQDRRKKRNAYSFFAIELNERHKDRGKCTTAGAPGKNGFYDLVIKKLDATWPIYRKSVNKKVVYKKRPFVSLLPSSFTW